MILALYAFRGYSQVSLNATLSITSCRGSFMPWPNSQAVQSSTLIMSTLPVTYTEWNRPGDDQAVPQLLQGDNSSGIEDTVQNLHSAWHPRDDSVSNCAALLYMHTDVRSRWVSIPCNKTYKESRALCSGSERFVTGQRQHYYRSFIDTLLAIEVRTCAPGYLYFQFRCFKITFVSPERELPMKKKTVHPAIPHICYDWTEGRLVYPRLKTFIDTLESYIFLSVSEIMIRFRQKNICFLLLTCSPYIAHLWAEVKNTSLCDLHHVRIDVQNRVISRTNGRIKLV